MDRCPNCGSSVRIGAKFCTTCGFRLPSEVPVAPPTTPTRSPFDTTSTASVSSRWPTPEPVPPVADIPAPEAPVAPESVEVAPQIPQTAELQPPDPVEDPATFTGWPAYGTGFGARPGWEDEAGSETTTPLPADLTGAPDVQSVEDAIHAWTGTPPEAPSQSSESEEAIVEAAAPDGEDAGETSDSLDWFEALESENKPVDETELPAQAPEVVENIDTGEYEAFLDEIEQGNSADPVAAEADEVAVADVEMSDGAAEAEPEPGADEVATDGETEAVDLVVPAAVASESAAAVSDSNPVARARELLDELSALLPQLSGTKSDRVVDVDAIANELASARVSTEAEKASMQSLRAAIATAQARPRDVDVMLDLVSRSGEIAALFLTHDAYAAAIDIAVQKLKGEFQARPEPRW